ncbi:ABC transporter permease [Campylobacter sp. MIT 99-7217]|uniref:FecCD family ABC transporter permease n=1 Tax=Campylobacter sp. MIT 99-7217 TaxID=535091 RepID=UPI00115B78FF|nr:iron ABC transporter permease [Campylobacter sp. MIT 99-7217]TQR34475.1 ABC transporter permease [Campylobacter sp. MIT 99-7217]
MITKPYTQILSLVFLFVLLLISMLLALSIGEVQMPLSKVFTLVFFPDSSKESLIIHDTRMPRIIAAVVVGGALALSGALYQGVIGNVLVSPGILGVLSGASFGAALAMVLGLSTLGIELFCFSFGLLAMGISLLLSFIFDQNRSILMLILGGIITSSFFGAGVSIIKILADPYNTLPNIVYWLMGSLASLHTLPLIFASLVFILSLILVILGSKVIDILNLDYESASVLGVCVKKMRLLFILGATLLASSSVALAGLIGWIGLVIPHMSRFIIGANHRFSLPFCTLFGSLFLLFCDTLARTLSNTEIPIGIMTSLFGIPLFALILFYNRKKALDA